MRKKFLLMTFLTLLFTAMGTNLLRAEDGNVAKVGNTEYATIDEAIAAWTNGTTLTLLTDVTLSNVIQLSSTEYHILDLSTFTMTAASKKDAIQIVNNGRSSASYALDIKADATNPGGITASGKTIVVTTGKSGVKDRPIIRFYNGVFIGTNIVKHSGSNGTNCPQFQFHGGEFYGNISTNRSLNQFYGGTFNGQLFMSVDSSAYTLIAGGTFKNLSNLYGSALNSGKFTIGSAKGVYDKEVYIDNNGNYVIAAAEPSEGIEADVAKTPGTNEYLYYSKVATEGQLGYTDVYKAIEKNNSGTITVYVNELDLINNTGFKGTIVVPADRTITITNAPTTLVVKDEEGNVLEPNADGTYTTVEPAGNNFTGYTGEAAIWGEVWGNATTSFVIKVLDDNDTVMGTTSLNNIGGIIDGDVNVTWNLKLDAESNTDEYWTMSWTTAPSIGNMPAKVELWVDGVKVSGGNVVLNGPDEIQKIYAAVTDADGKILSYHTSIAAAVAAIPNTRSNTQGYIALLRDTDEAITLPAGIVLNTNGFTADNIVIPVASVNGTSYATLEAAFAAATEGQTITLLADATPALTSQRAITKAAVIDLGGKTLTLTEDDLYFGTTEFKNGYIIVDPSVRPSTAVFWMFANQTLTFDNVKIVATGVTGTYLIGLDGNNSDLNLLNGSEIVVENTTALDLDIICVNASTGNDIKVENSKVNVTNLDGRVFFRGNYTVKDSEVNLAGITKAGFRIEAGQTLSIEGTSVVTITGELRDGGIHLTDLTATYTVAETATVNATVNQPVAVAQIGETKYTSLQAAIDAVQNGETIELLSDVTENVTLTEATDLYYTINGSDKTMNGKITVNSLSDTNDNRRITIKNIKFVDNTDADVDFISSVETNHYPRLTVEGCTFTGSGNNGDVAIRLKSSHSVVIKDCTGTGLHSFLQNTSGWNLTINNVTVTNSKSGLALGTVQGVTVIGSNIDVNGYGIRLDAKYNNSAVIESNVVEAFIPVVVRNAEVVSSITFNGTNTMTQTNTDGLWCAIGTSEYETNGTMPTAPTGQVTVTLNDTGLSMDGVYGAFFPVKIGETGYATLAAAAAAAQAGDEIILLADVTEDVTLPAGITLNGNGKAVGNIIAAGTITFNGHTKATSFNVENTNTTVNIVEGACLEITGTGRMVIGHGCTFNITGTITDAKNANVADLTPSLIMPGASFTGAGVTFNVTNAYISAPSSYCSSSSSASGTFDFNITNSIWESAGKLAFESQSTAATVNFELKDSKLTTGSHLVFGVSRGEVVFDNSNVNVGTSRQIENQSTMTVKNGSVVNGAVATSSNAKNPGTLIVDNATYAVTGEFSGSDLGTGTIVYKNGATISAGSITKANIQIDATGMAVGNEVNITANLANLAGTIEVINNNMLDAKIVDGKIVLVERTLQGEGTEASPYVITNLDDLKFFRDHVNEGNTYAGKYIKVTATEIDLNNEEWTPIAYMGKTFKGNFDGNNVTVKNLKITKALTNSAENNGIGFFGSTGAESPATIENIIIENVDITGSLYVGAIVGYGYTGKHVKGCTVKGDITIDAWWYAGVIGGNGYMNLVDDCHVIGNNDSYIKGNGGSYIGGIWGFRGEGDNKITNCTVTNLDIIGVDRVGGICGIGHYGNTISGCDAEDVTVTATDPEATTIGLLVGATQGNVNGPTIFENNDASGITAQIDNGDGTYTEVTNLYGTNINGSTPVTNYVAQIVGGTQYATLAEAVAAAVNNDVITLLPTPTNASIAMNASLYGKDVTITGTATVDWSKGFLFVGRGGEGNAKLTFESANLTSASDNASTGIHVSGREKNTNDKYDGTVEIKNSTIELDYLINKGTMTLDNNSTLTVKNGFSIGGRPASETESGEDATATITLNNGSKVVVNNHNGMGLGYEAIGIMNIDATSTFETTQSFLITAKGTMNVNGGNVKTVGTLTNNGAVNVTGNASMNVNTLTGNAINFTNVTIANANIGGAVNTFGTNNFTGETTIGGILSVGYNGSPAEQVVVNITGNFNGGNVLIGSSNDNVLNVGNAEGTKTTAHFGQLGAFGDVNIVNADVTYGYTFIRNDFNVTNSTMAINGGVNTYFSGNAKVVVDNSLWNLSGYANIGSYGGYMYGNADITLKNGSSMTATNLGIQVDGEKVVKLTLEDSSTLTATNLSNQGEIVLAGKEAKINSNELTGTNNVPTTNIEEYKVVYENGVYKVVQKVYVAQIGENKYESLQEAVNAAQNDETITLLVDVEQADGVIINSKNIVVDLNVKTFTVTEGASTNNRNFKINGNSVVTIKNGTMIAAGDYSSGAYGTVRTEGTAQVTLTGLKLYNYRGNGLNIKALGGTTVDIEDTEIYSQYGGGIEAAGGTITLAETVKVEQKGMYTAPYNSMAISVNGGGLVTVNGGTYSTECITAEEANNQGTSHGPWVVGVLNSGGKLIINGGTFSNDNYGDNSLATYARGAVLADTGAEIEIYGGTFNALKAIIDMTNNLGDENNNPSALLSGGTFSADPRISGLYASELIVVAQGYIVVENDGTYSVVEDQVAKIGDVTYNFLHKAFDAAEDDDEIVVLKDITYTKANGSVNGEYIDGLVYTGDKSFTVNFGGYTITDNGEINDYLVYLKNLGEKDNEITFKNGRIAINAETTAWAAITVGANSATYKTTLNLDNMEVVNGNPNEANNQVIRTRNGATVNLNNKTVVTSNGTSYGVVAETSSTVNINSGAEVVHTNSPGTTGGNLVYTAVSGNGIINIYDGATIESDRYAIHNMTSGNTVINIYGGTITAPVAVRVATNGGNGESAVANISGGTFTGSGSLETYTDAASIVIKGGTFSVDPSDYCAEGYSPIFNGSTYTVIQVSGTQTRDLQAGWNWFSSYVDLSQGGGLLKLQDALGESGLAIKGQTENQSVQYVKIGVVEGEEIYAWTGNQNWNPYSNKMYMIKTSKAMSAEEFGINGNFIDYKTTTIALFQGWNWISYPLNEPALINEALVGLTPTEGDQIKFRGNTFAEYYNGKWYPEDFVFMPGEGYMYKAESPNSFVYTKGTTNVRATNKTDENNNWMAQTSEYANNMTITAMLSIDGEIVKGNYEVAAFANGECRGSARPIYIEAIDAYVLYMTIYGDEVEELTFMYYDIDKDTEYELSNVMNYSNDAIVGTLSDPYIFSMNILGIGENSIDNINIYPNPTTTDREINLQATCDKVEVFNALGVKVAEYHNVDTLDALETAGIYVIRITNDNAVKHCRLVVK